MKKAVLIPDSFKGTLSSSEICEIMRERISFHFPRCEVASIPVADGGEGSVDAFIAAVGGKKVQIVTAGPYFEEIHSFFGLIDDGSTAIVEMAASAGLPLVENRKDPSRTTTFGVGQLLLAAAESGAKRIIVGLGGSATNDCGCGAASAAGVMFLDSEGKKFIPTGGTLKDVAHIDTSGMYSSLSGMEIITMCDIDNPMYGPNGAAAVFSPQKGAAPEMVAVLDEGLFHIAGIIKRDLGLDVAQIPGSGAAGAMGAGMVAFFGSRLQMGIETVLDAVNFERVAADADFIFTGEGKLDSQSLSGKVVIGVARRAKKLGKPVLAVVGGADYGIDAAYSEGVSSIFPISRLPQDFSILRSRSSENLSFTMDNILRLLIISQN
ncbi:MAG: glycerate kinase [Clostridia bacterium]|nr:glycerate kinase [Clostridia bacterium]